MNWTRNAALVCSLVLLMTATRPTSVFAQTSNTQLTDDLLELSRAMNRNLPLKIDNEKVLDTTVVVGSTLIVKYRFTDEIVISDPRFSKARYIAALRESLGKSTCKGSIEVLRRGAKFIYIFTNARGQNIIEFTLDAKECQPFIAGG